MAKRKGITQKGEPYKRDTLPDQDYCGDSQLNPLDGTIQRENWIAGGVGVFLLLVLLVISALLVDPTPVQRQIWLVTMALAAASFGTMLTGFLLVKIGKEDSNFFIRAGGAIAILVIIYFFPPAVLKEKPVANGTHGERSRSVIAEGSSVSVGGNVKNSTITTNNSADNPNTSESIGKD